MIIPIGLIGFCFFEYKIRRKYRCPKKKKNIVFETIGVHGGLQPDPTTGARVVPIYQNNAYQFKNTEHAANLFGLKEPGYIYTRIQIQLQPYLKKELLYLEGGVGALAVASGMAAITLSHFKYC